MTENAARGLPAPSRHRHADPALRRRRLRHAAVHPRRRPRGHARADELHQPRARCVRDGRRLHHRAADESSQRAVRRLPADRLRRNGAARRAPRAHALPADVRAAAPRPGPVLDRPRVHGRDGGRLLRRLDAAEHPAAAMAVRAAADRGGRDRQVPALHHRHLRAADRRAAVDPFAHALRQPPARIGRRSAHRRAGSVSMSIASSSSPSRSDRGSRGSAAHSAPKCSGSTRRSRSSS